MKETVDRGVMAMVQEMDKKIEQLKDDMKAEFTSALDKLKTEVLAEIKDTAVEMKECLEKDEIDVSVDRSEVGTFIITIRLFLVPHLWARL